jgi:anti-sigma regulatory factor (Ser/Thr protein kinase)
MMQDDLTTYNEKTVIQGKNLPSLRGKILRRMVLVALTGTIIIFFLIPYSFYKRDVLNAKREAQINAEIARAGLLSVMMSTGDPEVIRQAVDRYKEFQNFKFRMIRSKPVQKQFGQRTGEQPRDKIEEKVLNGELAEYSGVTGTTFRSVRPFIADVRCQRCHVDLQGEPVKAGTVLGVSEFKFDLEERYRHSRRLFLEVAIEMTLLIATIFITFYLLFAKNVIAPISRIVEDIASIEKEDFDITFLEPTSVEIDTLTRQISRTAESLKKLKTEREKKIEEEKKFKEDIKSFALNQASVHGIKNPEELNWIVNRFSSAVSKYEKAELVETIYSYINLEAKIVTLPNDISLIPPLALYLTSLIPEKGENIKRQSVELAIEEAVVNGILHGNLEINSEIKDENYKEFEDIVAKRTSETPYKDRTITINYHYDNRKAVFIIRDEGKGFDWRYFLNRKKVEDTLQIHGRGIILIRAFASSVEYNEEGNEITISFDL